MKLPLLFLCILFCLREGKSETTTNSASADKLAYNLKTTVEAYEKVGQKNPKWDQDAKRAFTAFSQLRSSTNRATEFRNDLRTILSQMAEAKCNDPLIRYLFIRYVFYDAHLASENAAAFGEVATEMEKSGYPSIRKFYATIWARRLLYYVEPKRPENVTLLTKAATFLNKALEDKSMPRLEAEEGCNFLLENTGWWTDPAIWNCYQILEPALTNRWKETSFALVQKGAAYLSYGWQARGSGYSDTVTDKGWSLMRERLGIAAEALETAWKLNSNNAQICLMMERVEMGQGKGRGRLETWFERGMKIDPWNYDLCYARLEYLRPRWYGSIKKMIDFGRECTTNTNYKGRVRLMLADAHYEASREIQDDKERADYWQQTNVWPDVKFAFEQFLKLYPEETGYRHNYARYAAWCGQWQELKNQVKLFPSTNYSFFGGVEQFNEVVKYADEQLKKK